jgi:hypothetical protein
MIRWFHGKSDQTGAFDSTDRHDCWIIVPFEHRIVSARVYTTQVVLTGTVNIGLRQADLGDARAGVLVGSLLENVDLVAGASAWQCYSFTLADSDKLTFPRRRIYHIMCDATNSADRFDEPQLLLEVDDLNIG